jgi:steroid Delta-isomerase
MQSQTAKGFNVPDRSPHVQLVMKYYQLVDLGDVAGLVELFTDDAEYHRPGYQPLVGRFELEDFYRNQRVIREGQHTITGLVASDECVAVQGEFTGSLRDNRTTHLRFADFFRFSPTGQVSRRDTFFFTPLV